MSGVDDDGLYMDADADIPPRAPVKYRHRETGTLARAVSYEQTLNGRCVTLDCLDNPTRHYEDAFPFRVYRSAIYANLNNAWLTPTPGPVSTEPLTISAEQLAADWEPVTDA